MTGTDQRAADSVDERVEKLKNRINLNKLREELRRMLRGSSKKWLAFDALLLAFVLVSGLLLARYVGANEQVNEMVAAGFHFSSAELLQEGAAATSDGIAGAEIPFDVNNFEVENVTNISGMKGNSEYASYDITYKVSAVKTVSGISTTISPMVSALDSDGAEVTASDGLYTMSCDGQTKITHILTMEMNEDTDGDGTADEAAVPLGSYCCESDGKAASGVSSDGVADCLSEAADDATTDVTVTAESSSPYVKTLKGDYDITGIAVTSEILGGGVNRLVIATNQYEGPLKIKWTNSTFPSAGVNEACGWAVQYNYSGTNRYAAQTVSKNTTYYFMYNASEWMIDEPSFSGTWATYDDDTDSWSGGAVMDVDDEAA